MYRLKQLHPLTHIIAPTAASVMIGIAIYYSLIDLVWLLSVAYIFLPGLIILAVIVTYSRKNKVQMDNIEQEDSDRRARRAQQ